MARRRSRRARRRPATLYFWAAGGLLALTAIAVTLLVVVDSGDGPPAAKKTTTAARSGGYPSVYSGSPSTPVFAAIKERRSDRSPLTADEAFGGVAKTLKDSSGRLELRTSRLDADCVAAVWGTALAERLRQGQCTQVSRAMYADTKQRYGAMVVVFNLANASAANTVTDALRPEAGTGFARPLPSGAPLDRFGQGFTTARGLAMGHYAVIAWVQRLDGTGDEKDETLVSLLVTAAKPEGVLRRAARPR